MHPGVQCLPLRYTQLCVCRVVGPPTPEPKAPEPKAKAPVVLALRTRPRLQATAARGCASSGEYGSGLYFQHVGAVVLTHTRFSP